ncbi:hypothetical protein EVAR_13749_1 [Eumeta japonica]|uniref:Retrovirus-related Pol polyprotein from transposon TNT 1-94 n=1 Tax=Eumeta variegata TaxID=151549 RepID=A0A4C1UBJ5_EUMVA|nr:hypothetical protein EVAR_13749_1 [Eumeta japonica]
MSPENFQEAMNCDDANEWKAAMDREMNSLVENKTWTLVDKPTKDKSRNNTEGGRKGRAVTSGFSTLIMKSMLGSRRPQPPGDGDALALAVLQES